jgi:hypothetical protein
MPLTLAKCKSSQARIEDEEVVQSLATRPLAHRNAYAAQSGVNEADTTAAVSSTHRCIA